jgi:hypothetical protein
MDGDARQKLQTTKHSRYSRVLLSSGTLEYQVKDKCLQEMVSPLSNEERKTAKYNVANYILKNYYLVKYLKLDMFSINRTFPFTYVTCTILLIRFY